MSTPLFKVGDSIRAIDTECNLLLVGKEYTVKRVTEHGHIIIDGPYEDGTMPESGASASAFERVKSKRDYVADHARRTLRKAGMTAKQAKDFVRLAQASEPYRGRDGRCELAFTGDKLDLSKFSRQIPGGYKLHELAMVGFSWAAAGALMSDMHTDFLEKGL